MVFVLEKVLVCPLKWAGLLLNVSSNGLVSALCPVQASRSDKLVSSALKFTVSPSEKFLRLAIGSEVVAERTETVESELVQ